MSFTMAWNNPPSAPHSFSTDSMVSKTNKKARGKTSIRQNIPLLLFQTSDCRPLFSSSVLRCAAIQQRSLQRGGCEDAQPTASSPRSAQTKRNVLLGATGCSCSLCRRYSPFGGTGGMEQGRSLLPGWTTTMQRGGHMHGGFSWSPFKHKQRREHYSGEEGKRRWRTSRRRGYDGISRNRRGYALRC